jgi:predicted transcriptional regulator
MEHGENPEHPIVPTMAAAVLDLPVARAAYSLKRLSEAGILDRNVTGRYTFYSLNETFLNEVKEFFHESW